MITIGLVESPYGRLRATVTDKGVRELSFGYRGSGRQQTTALLDEVRRQLEEYFSGTRRQFDLPLDLNGISTFARDVLDRVRAIPYGSVASYSSIAGSSGSPGAARAVGNVMATNPIPILIPCHRVVRANGSLGRYGGGDRMKRALLALEGFAVS